MRLLKSAAARAALNDLIEALDSEAAEGGEGIKTVVVTCFTAEDEAINNTAVLGCSCRSCLERARRSVKAIISGTAERHDVVPTWAH